MDNKRIEVMDIETLAGCITYTGLNIHTNKIVQFVLHKERWEFDDLITHLHSLKGQIGFNNLNFDYPVLHYILKNWKLWEQKPKEEIITLIYQKAQWIIEQQNNKGDHKVFVSIRDKEILISQLDLYRIWHYDNRAKATSLKALEISMNMENVMDMPIPHNEQNISLKQVDEILEYNLWDVKATYRFYLKTVELGKIDLRRKIQNKFNLPCFNWNNGKIGEQLILKLYSEKTGLNKYDVSKLRTFRDKIELKECIPNSIYFNTSEFQKLLDFYKNKTIIETKGSVEYSIIYKEHKYDFGTGGEHGIHKAGIYQSDDKYIIKSADVASLHPNLPLVFNFYPKHLGPEFLEVYGNNIVKVRLAEKAKPKKEQDKAIVDGYKEAANIPYGKSNSIHSFLYDPMYSMKTTIASQLVLSMLCERLSQIPDSQMLMSNTDGCEIIIPREYEHLYNKICKQWESETKLILEFADYQKMWIRDINNYGCLSVEGKVKNKGCFEVDKMVGAEPAYHKDNSFRIIPLALEEYFIKGIPIKDTIINHKNIYDFCGRQKFTSDSYGETHKLDYNHCGQPYNKIERQQKNVRYFINNNGSTFIKQYIKGSSEVINKGYQVEIFNKYYESENYDINYDYYIKEAQKELENIVSSQLTLF